MKLKFILKHFNRNGNLWIVKVCNFSFDISFNAATARKHYNTGSAQHVLEWTAERRIGTGECELNRGFPGHATPENFDLNSSEIPGNAFEIIKQ